VTVTVCTPDLKFSKVDIRPGGINTRIISDASNTELAQLTVDADTFQFIVLSDGARVTSATLNKKTRFEVRDHATLNIIPDLIPGDKIFFTAGNNATVQIAGLSSSRGGRIEVGQAATFISGGPVLLQNDGQLYNKGLLETTADLSVQGGANAIINDCGSAQIRAGGTLFLTNGTIHNSGTIKVKTLLVNSGGGPVFLKDGAVLEAGLLSGMFQQYVLPGDSIRADECATFKIGSYNSWNKTLTSSSRISYCGPPVSSSLTGMATLSCLCESERNEQNCESIITSVLNNAGEVKAYFNPFYCYSDRGEVKIKGIEKGKIIELIDINGNIITQQVSEGDIVTLTVQSAGIYLVKSGGQILRIAVYP
jgi:hypothetical protein